MTDCNCPACQALPTKHRLAGLLVRWLDARLVPDLDELPQATLDALEPVSVLFPPDWLIPTNDQGPTT